MPGGEIHKKGKITNSFRRGSTFWRKKDGEKNYHDSSYIKSEEKYKKASEKNIITKYDSIKSNTYYNMGNSLYKQNKYEEAEIKYNLSPFACVPAP